MLRKYSQGICSKNKLRLEANTLKIISPQNRILHFGCTSESPGQLEPSIAGSCWPSEVVTLNTRVMGLKQCQMHRRVPHALYSASSTVNVFNNLVTFIKIKMLTLVPYYLTGGLIWVLLFFFFLVISFSVAGFKGRMPKCTQSYCFPIYLTLYFIVIADSQEVRKIRSVHPLSAFLSGPISQTRMQSQSLEWCRWCLAPVQTQV